MGIVFAFPELKVSSTRVDPKIIRKIINVLRQWSRGLPYVYTLRDGGVLTRRSSNGVAEKGDRNCFCKKGVLQMSLDGE